jgi:uncharacterized membrane protein
MIYSVRPYSDATNLPEWARPFLGALLVLSIDLSLDAVAIRLGMGNWGRGLQSQYFGVPYANFWAWFWVCILVFSRDVWIGPSAGVGRALSGPVGCFGG